MSNPLELILSRLQGVRRSGAGLVASCPGHDDRRPSLSINVAEDGRILLFCLAGCFTVNVLRAMGLSWMHLYPAQNVQFAQNHRRLSHSVGSERFVRRLDTLHEPITPTPDNDRTAVLLRAATAYALNEHPDAVRFADRRGIDLRSAATNWDVGFMPHVIFQDWAGPGIRNIWTIPVTDQFGGVVAVKLHREDPPEGAAKGFWAPLGTAPSDKPRHGFSTLWPDPDTAEMQERIGIREFHGNMSRTEAERITRQESPILYVLPGELKALSVLCAGRCATSVTAGEGHRWTPGQVQRLSGRHVVIVYDDDDAGHKFRDRSIEALADAVQSLKTITFGKKGTGR